MFSQKRKTGNLGEDLACRYLEKHGYTIVEKNYLKKCGEIDIVTKKDDKLHFIEVKSVSCLYGQVGENINYRPEENVHPAKLRRLTKTIQIYLTERHVSDETKWQINVITVLIDKRNLKAKINLIENVFI